MPLKIHTNVQVAADGSKADGTVTSPPFPEQRVGTRSGTNGLYRLNYFNGRFLTAEALRREQVYWDTRARLVAQTHGAGIAWGLSLNLPVFPAPFRDQDVPAGWRSVLPLRRRRQAAGRAVRQRWPLRRYSGGRSLCARRRERLRRHASRLRGGAR